MISPVSNVRFGASVGYIGVLETVKQVLQPGVKLESDIHNFKLTRGGDSISLEVGTDRKAAQDIINAVERDGVRIVDVGHDQGGILSNHERHIFELAVAFFDALKRVGGLRSPLGIEKASDALGLVIDRVPHVRTGRADENPFNGRVSKTRTTILDSDGHVKSHEK